MNKKCICGIVLCFVILIMSDAVFALPINKDVDGKKEEAGHAGLTKRSAEIKRTLPESSGNGLNAALGGNRKEDYETFQKSLATSSVAEDLPGIKGMFHFYNVDATIFKGYLGFAENAKDRAKGFYRTALTLYCAGKATNDQNYIKKAWDAFGHAEHLMQDMTSPPHTQNLSHIF
jgi:hypothetical protein